MFLFIGTLGIFVCFGSLGFCLFNFRCWIFVLSPILYLNCSQARKYRVSRPVISQLSVNINQRCNVRGPKIHISVFLSGHCFLDLEQVLIAVFTHIGKGDV
uniref:Uncharacterized protein n=1 Tax=Cacopsylla melanoneura TaxID=428564 RepID=A0A8D9E7R4_9HEMI